MDVIFDAKAAIQLLQHMDSYCSEIQKEARDLLSIVKTSGEWNDRQMEAFQANIYELAKDLNQALAYESEYMRTYMQRVQELRGQ